MNKQIKENLFVLNNVFFLITTAVVLTLIVAPWIHGADVKKYGLDVYSHLSQAQIKDEMTRLVGYLWLWHRQPLELHYFPMSTTGVIHFAEVKVFVDFVQVIWIITTSIFCIGAYKRLKNKEILFLKQSAYVTIFILVTLMLFGIVAFDKLFVLFHQIVFRNDYWMFSSVTDPVIKILPEEFFMHGFFAIVGFVFALCFIFIGIYHYYINQARKNME